MLAGPRIVVRPLTEADWQGMFAAASDPEVWAQHPEPDRCTEIVFRQFFDAAINSGSAFAFVDRASGAIVGSSRYHGHDPEAREIEIGWTFLARAYWGGSYNREIKKLMLEHAFQLVDSVVFRVGETNWRSRKAMEKIGGSLRDATAGHAIDDRDTGNVIYEIREDRSAFT